MKKIFFYSTLILVAITFFACGRKEKNIYLGKEIETEMPSEIEIPSETAVAVTPRVTVPSITDPSSSADTESESTVKSKPIPEPEPAPEQKPTSKPEPATETHVPQETTPSQTQPSTTDDSADSSGITFNEDGTVTVSQEILSQLAEEEKNLISSLGLTDEQVEILISSGDVTLSVELQNKLQDYLDTLPLTEKLRLLGKLATLLEN